MKIIRILLALTTLATGVAFAKKNRNPDAPLIYSKKGDSPEAYGEVVIYNLLIEHLDGKLQRTLLYQKRGLFANCVSFPRFGNIPQISRACT